MDVIHVGPLWTRFGFSVGWSGRFPILMSTGLQLCVCGGGGGGGGIGRIGPSDRVIVPNLRPMTSSGF